jgi:membrane protease YdiL (CAAX protease family)
VAIPASPEILLKPAPPGQPDAVDYNPRVRFFEIFLVLLVAFGSSVANALNVLIHPLRAPLQYTNFSTFLRILHEAGGLLLLGYIFSRSRRRLSDIGLRWSASDIGVGLLLFLLAYTCYAGSYRVFVLLHYLAFNSVSSPQVHREYLTNPLLFVLPYYLLNPFFEELIVRAYLMTEVTALTGSAGLAIAVSVLFQTAYHLYYGWVVALSIGCVFLVFSAYYAKTRRALPIIVAHACMDLVGFFSIISR